MTYYNDEKYLFLVDGEWLELTEEEAEELDAEDIIPAFEVEDIVTDRYPTISSAPSLQVASEIADMECECQQDLPDGRSFPLCLPCKMRQDFKRYEQELKNNVLDLDATDEDIPFLF